MPRKHREIFSTKRYAPTPSRKFNRQIYNLWTYGNRKQLLHDINTILATDSVSYRLIYTAGVWAVYIRRK